MVGSISGAQGLDFFIAFYQIEQRRCRRSKERNRGGDEVRLVRNWVEVVLGETAAGYVLNIGVVAARDEETLDFVIELRRFEPLILARPGNAAIVLSLCPFSVDPYLIKNITYMPYIFFQNLKTLL